MNHLRYRGRSVATSDAGADRSPGINAPPPPPAVEPLAVGASEAARRLGISPRTLWTLTRTGRVRAARVGRRVLYPLAELQRFIAERQHSTPQAANGENGGNDAR